jgi:hypothetical protein
LENNEKPPSDKKAPGFWFYTADFERDVQILSLASQGLWIRMMCWMSDNEMHRGFLELPNGTPMLSGDIAAKVGRPNTSVQRCLDEMERLGIFSKDERGCVYSRRMARDTHISSVRREAAKARHDTEKRAASGQFCSDFAPAKQDFAPPKPHAKGMQKPTVTASVPVSASVPVLQLPQPAVAAAPIRHEYPLTLAVIREHDAAADHLFCLKLAHAIAGVIPDGWPPGKAEKALSDPIIARACRESYATPGRNGKHGAGLLLSTVPRIVIGGKTNYV